MKYMVALDASPFAASAFYRATEMLKDSDKIFLLACPEIAKKSSDLDAFIKIGQDLLKQFEDYCDQKQLRYKALVVPTKRAKEEICEQAQRHNIDILVVGSRGLGTVSQLLLGSVSNYCVANCVCDVLVVHTKLKGSL